MITKILKADITKLEVDVIVNAANKYCTRGGGVSGAIHSAAGPELEKECIERKKELGIEQINIGDVLVTHGHNLPCSYVFHTLGPVYGQDDVNLLKRCYENCLQKAESMNLKSIAFPGISTGVFGVPVETSAKIVKQVLDEFQPHILKEVFFVFIKDEDVEIYNKHLK